MKIFSAFTELIAELLLIMTAYRFLKKRDFKKPTVKWGVFTYILFPVILYGVTVLLLETDGKTLKFLNSTPVFSAVSYAAIITVFAFFGRLLSVKLFLKNQNDIADGVSFAYGYAAANLCFQFVLSSIALIIASVTVLPEVFSSTSEILSEFNIYTAFLDIFHSAVMFVFSASVSLLVFLSLKKIKPKYFLPLCFVLEVTVHFVASLSSISRGISLLICAGITLISAAFVSDIFKKK